MSRHPPVEHSISIEPSKLEKRVVRVSAGSASHAKHKDGTTVCLRCVRGRANKAMARVARQRDERDACEASEAVLRTSGHPNIYIHTSWRFLESSLHRFHAPCCPTLHVVPNVHAPCCPEGAL